MEQFGQHIVVYYECSDTEGHVSFGHEVAGRLFEFTGTKSHGQTSLTPCLHPCGVLKTKNTSNCTLSQLKLASYV